MKTVVITGGASGLGLAMGVQWAKSGATICLVDRSEDMKESAIEAITQAGGTAHFFQCDVTDAQAITRLREFTDTTLPPVDVLINSAGVPTAGSFEAESMEAWQWVIDINLLGTVRLIKAYSEHFRKQKSGHIVNVASQAGLTPMPMMGSYNATKAAVVALSETLRLELSAFGVGVSVLCPAFVKTNLDKSLPTEQAAMQDVVTKLVQRGTVTPEEVALKTYEAVSKNQFLVVTHSEGRQALRLKRWFPKIYYWLMARRTKHFTQQGYTHEPSRAD